MTGLQVRYWGEFGDRTAVLVHGMTTDSGTWSRVGPELARRGYRVVAPDLPGHGDSDRADYSLSAIAQALLDAVPARPDLALAHSFGGLVLSSAVDRLLPVRAVFEDPPWGPAPGPDAVEAIQAQRAWSLERLTAQHPSWDAEALREKHRALALWDPRTASLVKDFPGPRAAPPVVPSLVVVGDVQPMVGPRLASRLSTEGYEVRTVAGAGHNVHNDDPDGFWAALNGWV